MPRCALPLTLTACLGLLSACGPSAPAIAPQPAAQPAARTAALEVVATLTETRPGNIAVTPDGRVIITNHPLDGPALRVVEVMPDGTTKPFPTEDWADGPEKGDVGIAGLIGIAADTRGNVWLLDMGGPDAPPQIIAWDTRADALHLRLPVPPDVIDEISFLQDFALDEKRRQLYIADMTFPGPGQASKPAFVVIDLETGEGRRVLEGAAPLMPSDRDVVIGGSLVGRKVDDTTTAALRLGLNPIAIDPAFEWVYFGTINGETVYRLPASALADPGMDAATLAGTIEAYADKRPCDGIAVDGQGRVFITDIEASAVGVATPDGYRVIARDDVRLAWPDGFALGPDGALYVTQNQLHAHPGLNEGVDETQKPFHILKLKP